MKKNLLLLIFLLLSIGCATTRVNKLSRNLSPLIEDAIRNTDPNVNIGIKITSLDNDQVIFERNAERNFVPSSTLKIITVAAALHYLGPSFRYKTGIYTDSFSDHTLKNLYLKGSGDPSLMDFDLINLVSELKQMGITEVEGDIFVDDSIFDDQLWSSGSMWDDRDRGFAAPVKAINLNYNRLLIKTVPGQKEGHKAHSLLSPDSSFVDIDARATTKKSGNGKNLSFLVDKDKNRQLSVDGLHKGDKIIIEGHTSRSQSPHYQLLAINDPSIFAGTFLKDELKKHGIKVSGTVKRKTVLKDSILLTEHQSRSLSEALIDFTKISNNVGNDAVLKTIAAQNGSKPASLKAGIKLVNDFLSNEVKMSKNILMTDGSGLSRYNLITPSDMVKLLNYAAKDFYLGPEFIAALPIGGEDGTLTNSFSNMRGQIRAKTGSMTGINCLAGYIIADDNSRYSFAIMINGFIGSSSKYVRLQENILAAILSKETPQIAGR